MSGIEEGFKEFVRWFGGEVVPEATELGEKSADYVFRSYSVVAELKCLEQDQTANWERKRNEIIQRGIAKQRRPGALVSPNSNVPRLSVNGEDFDFDLPMQQEFQRTLRKTIEGIIRNADKQIAGTKKRLSLSSANGVILIFNNGNPLHAANLHAFAEILGHVIQETESQSGEHRFPHIQGAIYFSLNVHTIDPETKKSMPFFFPMQVRGPAADSVRRFQEDFRRGWYEMLEAVNGVPVVLHDRKTGWPE